MRSLRLAPAHFVQLDRLRPDDGVTSPFGYEETWTVAHTFIGGADGGMTLTCSEADDNDLFNLHADVADRVERIDKDLPTFAWSQRPHARSGRTLMRVRHS